MSNQEPIASTKPKYPRKLSLSDFIPECHIVIADYKCPLCEGITNNPVVDSCGHFYCEECYTIYTKTSAICPVDNQTELRFEKSNKIPIVSVILEKQTVLCKNRVRDCGWKGKLQELNKHLNDQCLKQFVPCLNKECKNEICRESLQEHMKQCEYRMEKCNDCKDSLPFNQLKDHNEVCPKANITCPQECGESILREELKKHIGDKCLFTVVPCPFEDLGCGIKVIKKELNKHLETQILMHNINLFEIVRKIGKDYKDMFDSFHTRLLKLETPGLCKPGPGQNQMYQSNQAQIQGGLFKQQISNSITQSQPMQLIQINNQITQPTVLRKNTHSPNIINLKPNTPNNQNNTKEEDKTSIISSKSNPKTIKSKEENEPVSKPLSSKSDEDSNHPNKTTIFYDIKHVSHGICINVNTARCLINNKNEHRYLFLNYSIMENSKASIHEWKIVVNPASCWIGMGVCNKEAVLKNQLKFFSSQPGFNHNTFCISTNGFLWNCANNAENNFNLPNFPKKIERGDSFYFTYNKNEKVLEFKINTFSAKLTQVSAPILTPCILFLHQNDEVEVYFK